MLTEFNFYLRELFTLFLSNITNFCLFWKIIFITLKNYLKTNDL